MSTVMQINLGGALLALLQAYNQEFDREHSLNYTFEDCLEAGITAKRRSKEYSIQTENRKRFEKAIAADPSVVLHPDRMLGLMKKYHIGASNEKLEAQVLEAAEQMQKEQEEAELEKATAPATPSTPATAATKVA